MVPSRAAFAVMLWHDGEVRRAEGVLIALVAGVERVVGVESAARLAGSVGVSKRLIGMTVVGLGESLEETARMVAPARTKDAGPRAEGALTDLTSWGITPSRDPAGLAPAAGVNPAGVTTSPAGGHGSCRPACRGRSPTGGRWSR
jgi:hypothetical protein